MKKTKIKILEEIKSIGMTKESNPDITTHEFCFLLKAIILKQQREIENMRFEIAKLNGQVEDD